jgi:hypothetical protein
MPNKSAKQHERNSGPAVEKLRSAVRSTPKAEVSFPFKKVTTFSRKTSDKICTCKLFLFAVSVA